MGTFLCCKHTPILLDGALVFVCTHEGNRTLMDENGYYILQKGKKITFNNLRTIGKQYTDRFGELTNYTTESK